MVLINSRFTIFILLAPVKVSGKYNWLYNFNKSDVCFEIKLYIYVM